MLLVGECLVVVLAAQALSLKVTAPLLVVHLYTCVAALSSWLWQLVKNKHSKRYFCMIVILDILSLGFKNSLLECASV